MLLSSLVLFCCAALPTDFPRVSTDPAVLVAADTANSTHAAKPQPKLPDTPLPKESSSLSANAVDAALASEPIAPAVQPFAPAPIKPAARGTYETARQRKIWYGLMATGHSAAVFDAYTTRRALSGGYGTESNPLMRPFAHSNAIYAATQVSPTIMDFVGHRMMTSNHQWMRRLWWVPQVAGAGFSIGVGVHNYNVVP